MMKSSWISSILYKRCPDGHTYIAVFTRDKEPTAMLLGGPEHPIPEWLPGLLHAGTPKKEEEGYRRSIGRAYHKLLKDKKGKFKYRCQIVKGKRQVNELKEMMK